MFSNSFLRFVLVAVALMCLTATYRATAGVIVIGDLHPYPQPNVSPGVEGITFDYDRNPLVLDQWAWTLQRIDKTTAAVLSSVTSNPVTSFNEQLVFDPTTLAYFTRGYDDATGDILIRIDPVAYNHATVGPLGTPLINFGGLAIDPAGNLWLGIDSSTEQLWTVDKGSGAAAFSRNITFPGGFQLHSMTIGSDGTFYAAAKALAFNDGGEGIYRIDPNTGVATFVTSTNPPASNYALVSMTQDPATLQYYGIWSHFDFSDSAYKFQLVEVTGVPEPCGLWGLCVLLLQLRRRRQ